MSRFLAIDIDAAGLFVVAGTARGGAARVEHAVALADGTLPPLSASTAAAVGARLKDALHAAGVAPAPALVGVGRDRVILKELRYPPVPDVDEPHVVRFQALKELTESPDDVVLDYVRTDDVGGERRATVVAVRKDLYLSIQAMCAAAGLKLAAVTPRPYALAAGFGRAVAGGAATLDTPGETVAVVHAGPGGGEFVVVRGGRVAFARSVPAPAVATATGLVAELRRDFAVYDGSNAGHPVKAVYVPEADGSADGWAGRLVMLPVPVRAFDPLAGAAAGVPAEMRARYAGAAGLLAARAAAELPINFAAPRQPKAAVDPNRRVLLLGALAAAVVFLAAAAFGYLELARASRDLDAAQAEKQAADDDVARLEADAKKVQAIDDWGRREVVWLDELYDLSDRLPAADEVRVTTLTAAAKPVDKNGRQVAQAELKLGLATKTSDAAAALVSAFDRDNAEKVKFYTEETRTATGANGPGGFNLLYTFSTLVNHRDPARYSRLSTTSPPPRGAAATAAAAAAGKPAAKAGGKYDDPWFNE